MIFELVNRYGHVAGVCPTRKEAEVLREVLKERAQYAAKHISEPFDWWHLSIKPRLVIE